MKKKKKKNVECDRVNWSRIVFWVWIELEKIEIWDVSFYNEMLRFLSVYKKF